METTDRQLGNAIIRQRTKDSYYRLDDILAIGNLARIQNGLKPVNFSIYLNSTNTQDFLNELEQEIGMPPYFKGAKNRSGWVHPYFMIKILTWFNPKFEVQVYKWLFDYLIDNRIKGGNSYQIMSGVLFTYTSNKVNFHLSIRKLAKRIKELLGVEDWNKATKKQLEDRELIHNYITDLTRTLKDSKQGVKLGLEMYKRRLETNEIF